MHVFSAIDIVHIVPTTHSGSKTLTLNYKVKSRCFSTNNSIVTPSGWRGAISQTMSWNASYARVPAWSRSTFPPISMWQRRIVRENIKRWKSQNLSALTKWTKIKGKWFDNPTCLPRLVIFSATDQNQSADAQLWRLPFKYFYSQRTSSTPNSACLLATRPFHERVSSDDRSFFQQFSLRSIRYLLSPQRRF